MTKNGFIRISLALLLALSAFLPYTAVADAAEGETITVAEAIANNSGSATVQGYIVGTVNSGSSFDLEAPFTSDTNLALADSPDETDPAKILPVQLPSGSIREGLNLKANPENHKAEITITGTLAAYFSVPGLRSPTNYSILSEGEAPPEPTAVGSVAEARSSDGERITVEAIVTTGTGYWGGAAFYIQDETAGLYVYTSNASVAAGDKVQLTGTTSLYSGELQLQPSDIEVLSTGNELPAVQTVTPAGVNDDVQGERIELQNVTISNLKSVNSYGTFEFTATAENGETVIVRNDNRNGLAYDEFSQHFKEGDLIHLSGIASKYNSTFQVKTLGLGSFELVNKPAVYTDVFPGVVSEGTEVALSTGWENAAIYYTTDGSEPTEESTEYTAPITLSEDTVIKAIAVGDQTSEVFTFEYTVLKTQELKISDIQGEQHFTSYEGQPVAGVEGVVTYVVNGSNFYMQDPNPDDNPSTSEAILVYSRNHGLAVGDLVAVDGTVTEWFVEGYSEMKETDLPVTELTDTTITKLGTVDVPEALVLGIDVIPPSEVIDNDGLSRFEPTEDGVDFWESLEGMLVTVPDAQVIGPQKYGEVFVVAENSPNTEFHKQGGIRIAEDDYNPEKLSIDINDESFVAKAGDSFDGNITGPISYGYGNYKLLTSKNDLPSLIDGGMEPEKTWIQIDEDKLTVAAYNMENFSADPSHTSDEKAARIAASFVEDMKSPDIITLVEVQDNDGPTASGNADASETYARLIAAIEAAGGPAYEFTDIAPEYNKDGGQPGGNIRVGFLYNPERVSLAEGEAGDYNDVNSWTDGELTLNPGRIEPNDMPNTRKPIAAQFEFNGEKVVVIGAHLNSKGGDQPLFGQNQPPMLGSEEERIELATKINNFIEEGLAQDPNLNVVVAGDMNDFEFTPALEALKGDVLVNKVEDVPAEDRYSYYYQGNSQVLDHVLVTKNIADQTEIDMLHINAMFMEEHGRASDHDPILVQIDFAEPAAEPGVHRISGKTRYQTAVELSKQGWEQSDVVVLARGDHYADALAGVPLAKMHEAPLLLTRTAALPAETLEEINRLGAATVYILGGTGAVSEEVVQELEGEGLEVKRLSGVDRYETAAKIADEFGTADSAIVVSGQNFPDAMSVASYAGADNMPILLTRSDKLPEASEVALFKLKTSHTLVIGGTGVVGKEVIEELPTPYRISGPDRYATSLEVAKYFGTSAKAVYISTGKTFADALPGGALAAKEGTGVYLVGKTVPAALGEHLQDKGVHTANLIGGSAVVSEEIADQLEEYLTVK